MLGKIARQSNDSRLRDVLKPAVSEVEAQEDEHLNWTKEQLARLEFAALSEQRKSIGEKQSRLNYTDSARTALSKTQATIDENCPNPGRHCEPEQPALRSTPHRYPVIR